MNLTRMEFASPFRVGDRVRLKRGSVFESKNVRSVGYDAVGVIVSIRFAGLSANHYISFPGRKRTFGAREHEIEKVTG